MGSTEVIERISNAENESFKENDSTKSNENGCSNMKQKCYRKGSRICYTDIENITMLKKIPEKDTSQISIAGQPENEIYDKADSYRSGESLFKTFTFEQTRDINDPETLKCIEFWKGVMQKNLAPIKCTLIESDKKKKTKTTKTKKKSLTDSQRPSITEKPMEVEAEKTDFAADQERIWTQALKEIRERKLDKFKLYVREKCEYCKDPFIKSFADESTEEKLEQMAEIEALNDWAPKGKRKSTSRVFIMRGLHPKIGRMSSTQTTEDKLDKSVEHMRVRSSTYPGSKQSDGKLAAHGKHFGKHISPRSSIYTVADNFTSTFNPSKITEVQVPDAKCSCDSKTCVCSHQLAGKKSRSSLIEAAKQHMLKEDKSAENISLDETCICKMKQMPWITTTCTTEQCLSKEPERQPDVQESSSDFNLTRQLEIIEKSPPCICGKFMDVVCSSKLCKNKRSEESIYGDVEIRKAKERESCTCPDDEAPCQNETCPIMAPKQTDGKCVCRTAKPWCEVKCKSWSCRVNQEKIRKQLNEDDAEELPDLKKLGPIREVTSICACEKSLPWRNVQCVCDLCTATHKPVSILQTEDKRRRSSLNIKKIVSQINTETVKIDEPKKVKKTEETKRDCTCSTAEPWRAVTCLTYCDTKEKLEKKKQVAPMIVYNQIETPEYDDTTCVCYDKTLEPTCKAHTCLNRKLNVEYPPPCICPKDVDDSKQEHFRCNWEECKMKKIDTTCICSKTPGAPCNNKTCATNPSASKTLKPSNKRLNYDTKCICRVRGLPTTEDVSCTVPNCAFRKKPLPKIKKPPQAVPPTPPEEPTNKSKCMCKIGDTETICENIKCRGKQARKASLTEENGEDEEPASCICNDDASSGQEVICHQVQCKKVSITEDGVVMNDKCVCTTTEPPCTEPNCIKTTEERNENVIAESLKDVRPYCYICGHYDCASTKNRTDDNEICAKN